MRETIRRARGKQEQSRATAERAFDDAELAPVVDLFGDDAHEREDSSAGIVSIVGAIRREAPEVAADLRDAIGVWLELDELRPSHSLSGRRERLEMLRGALQQQAVDLDPRD